MDCPGRRSAYGKRRKAACRKLGIHKEKLERSAQACAKREGVIGSSTESHISHVLSARMSSRPIGLEPGRCRQTVTDKDILEEWKRHAEAGKATERRSDSRRS